MYCTLQSTLETTFRVFNFRDWFGVSCLYCTLQSTLETTFRVFNFRDWFGVSCLYCTLESRLETTFRVLILGIGLRFHVCIAPFKAG